MKGLKRVEVGLWSLVLSQAGGGRSLRSLSMIHFRAIFYSTASLVRFDTEEAEGRGFRR
jgi:hypothetical protein